MIAKALHLSSLKRIYSLTSANRKERMTAIDVQMDLPIEEKTSRKKILILMSEGGGGHKVASFSMKEILSSHYDVEIVSALPNIMQQIDCFTFVTQGAFTGDDFYNFLLQRGHLRAVSLLARMGLKYMVAKRNQIDQHFRKFLLKSQNKYDMIISTFPYINCGLAMAAQKMNIPFLVMPTDLDTATFFCGLSEMDFTLGGRFAFALPYDDIDLMKKAFNNSFLPKDKVHVTGFPVGKNCLKRFSSEDIVLLKFKHGLRTDSLIFTMILGAAGSEFLLDYSLELFKLDPTSFHKPIEMNICVGRYEKMQSKIKEAMLIQGARLIRENSSFVSIKTPKGVVIHIRKYVQEMVELMASSSLIITKTGSCTVNESIYLGKKLLLDNTENSSARYLQWENFNVPFVRKHGLGDAFTELRELIPMIKILMQEDLGHPVLTGAFPVPNFAEELHQLIQKMIS
ncbi:MAG: hypothetical protein EBZ47_00180 [Chlamydiae bacterium]|nr:hypothetical protein [Chlamydiota bacterium]